MKLAAEAPDPEDRMGVLSELLKDTQKRRAIVDDGVRVIDAEVADKRGMTGVAVKGAFKMVKGVKPGFIGQALDHLMPAFAEQIDPIYDAWKASGQGTLRQYMTARDAEVANALLAITDARAERVDKKVLARAYHKLRPQGVEHTKAAVPRLADLIAKHVG